MPSSFKLNSYEKKAELTTFVRASKDPFGEVGIDRILAFPKNAITVEHDMVSMVSRGENGEERSEKSLRMSEWVSEVSGSLGASSRGAVF